MGVGAAVPAEVCRGVCARAVLVGDVRLWGNHIIIIIIASYVPTIHTRKAHSRRRRRAFAFKKLFVE